MSSLFASPLFGIGVTLVAYRLAQGLYRRTRQPWCNPVAVASGGIIVLLRLGEIPHRDYAQGGQLILFLLGPAVVALALPLYQRRGEIRKRSVPILAGVVAGSLASVLSAAGLAWLLGGSAPVVASLAPKSATTPIAIGISEAIGGIVPLTAALVVLTGCLGAVCGPEFCRWVGVRSRVALGLAVGTASHGIGTARLLGEDRLGGAIAGLAIGLNGLATVLLVPLLWLLLG